MTIYGQQLMTIYGQQLMTIYGQQLMIIYGYGQQVFIVQLDSTKGVVLQHNVAQCLATVALYCFTVIKGALICTSVGQY